jgi:hypothetical protein
MSWKKLAIILVVTTLFSTNRNTVGQTQSGEQIDIREMGIEGGASSLDANSLVSYVIFDENALKYPVEVKHNVSSSPATNYPKSEGFKQTYDVFQVKPVGPQTVLELPFSALNMKTDKQRTLIYIAPVYDQRLADPAENMTAEVRITLADGSVYFYPDTIFMVSLSKSVTRRSS